MKIKTFNVSFKLQLAQPGTVQVYTPEQIIESNLKLFLNGNAHYGMLELTDLTISPIKDSVISGVNKTTNTETKQ